MNIKCSIKISQGFGIRAGRKLSEDFSFTAWRLLVRYLRHGNQLAETNKSSLQKRLIVLLTKKNHQTIMTMVLEKTIEISLARNESADVCTWMLD